MYDEMLYGSYRNQKFTDIFGDVDTFIAAYDKCGLPKKISEDSINTLYFLLYGRYGNSTIASADEQMFKSRLFGIVFQYGPTWEKELEIQDKVRGMSEEELMEGSTRIFNRAMNPATNPTTDTLKELEYINEQNTSKTKRGKVEQYALVLDLLKKDVSESFLKKFKPLFLTIVAPERPLWYVEE